MTSRFLLVLCAAAIATTLLFAQQPPASPTKVEGKGVTKPGGLQYWDIKEGTGRTAVKGSNVVMNYTGWLENGKRFDSSIGRGPFPVELGMGNVIKGWDEGIVGMKVGGKRQLKIPPDMAYGPSGHPPQIPPNSTLIFDVELVAIK
jgi:peptidylprolyl isomerase